MHVLFSNGSLGQFSGRYWGHYSDQNNPIELSPRPLWGSRWGYLTKTGYFSKIGTWRFFVWVVPSVALTVAYIFIIGNVKGGNPLGYDPTHQKLFTGENKYGENIDVIKLIEDQENKKSEK